jgi:hypothetical protein
MENKTLKRIQGASPAVDERLREDPIDYGVVGTLRNSHEKEEEEP